LNNKDKEICMCGHMRIDHFRGRGKCCLCEPNLGQCCSHYEKSDGNCEDIDGGERPSFVKGKCRDRGKYHQNSDTILCHYHYKQRKV